VFDIQVAIPRQPRATPFNFCVSSVKPVFGPATPPASCPTMAGNPVCGPQDMIYGLGNYAIQNNVNNSLTGQCIHATSSGNCAAFSVSFSNFGVTGTGPSSYPSAIYGWHNGAFYGAYQSARRLNQITTVNSSWTFSPPSGTQWDAAYDIWLDSANADPNTPITTTTELMIWLNWQTANPNATGPATTTAQLGGETWVVYQSRNPGWNYVAYRRTNKSNAAFNGDLMQFFNDAADRGYLQAKTSATRDYLLGVEAGFEVWGPNFGGTAGTTNFSATAN
jgi:hypothetical protein